MIEIDWQMALISAIQADPEAALPMLSGAVNVALSCGFPDEAWQRIEQYLADDGSGTPEQKEVQATLLCWLRAERRLALARITEGRSNG